MSAIVFPSSNPITARVAPNAREPTSPIKILAGYTLKYKNEIRDPISKAKKIESGTSKIWEERNQSPNSEIINEPDASPSKPSVILTAFANERIVNVAKGIKKTPSSKVPIKGM